jgi:hypothetical protein
MAAALPVIRQTSLSCLQRGSRRNLVFVRAHVTLLIHARLEKS